MVISFYFILFYILISFSPIVSYLFFIFVSKLTLLHIYGHSFLHIFTHSDGLIQDYEDFHKFMNDIGKTPVTIKYTSKTETKSSCLSTPIFTHQPTQMYTAWKMIFFGAAIHPKSHRLGLSLRGKVRPVSLKFMCKDFSGLSHRLKEATLYPYSTITSISDVSYGF